MSLISELQRYAQDHYESGGHWVVECFDAGDYQEYLDQASGDIARARRALKRHWQQVQQRCDEVRAEIF